MGIKSIFAANLKRIREGKGFTQASLAEAAGIGSGVTISRMENEDHFVADTTADAIAKVLKIEAWELFRPVSAEQFAPGPKRELADLIQDAPDQVVKTVLDVVRPLLERKYQQTKRERA